MKSKILLALVILVAAGAVYAILFNKKSDEETSSIPTPTVQLQSLNTTPLKTYKGDTSGYTEGLEFYKGVLYRSNGEYGKSSIVSYKSGSVEQEADRKKMPDNIFAEGITILNDTIYQLSYREKIVTLYNANNLATLGTLPWKYGEGWGLTNNTSQLIASNGTNVIYFLNKADLSVAKTINVNISGTPVDGINELEYVNGYIYANRFTTDYIYKIDANTGNIIAQADLKGLLQGYDATSITNKGGEHFLNGIAYNPTTQSFFITGKNWPTIFEIKF